MNAESVDGMMENERNDYSTKQCSGFRIRIHMFMGLPDPDPLVRGMEPDPDPVPSISKQKW
jgi:hypothetical protein